MESQAYVEAHGSEGNVGGDDEAGNSGIKYFMVAVPKAVAFYMVQVPLMGLNPIGVIRKGIEEQPRPVLSKMEVAAYAIPAGVFTALVSGVFAAIALAVNGQFGGMVGALITALPSAAISGPSAGWWASSRTRSWSGSSAS
jgi:hypothetical protein